MTYTEAEARMKWCPHVRVARRENTDPRGCGSQVVVAGCNTDALEGCRVPKSCTCIASDCMMWRWAAPERETMRSYHGDLTAPQPQYERGVRRFPDGWQYDYTDIDRDGGSYNLLHREPALDAPKRGFCGLAGKVGDHG